MARLPLLTSDKKRVSILGRVEVDTSLPKYKAAKKLDNNSKLETVGNLTNSFVEGDNSTTSVLSYNELKDYFLSDKDLSITEFNVKVSESMRQNLNDTWVGTPSVFASNSVGPNNIDDNIPYNKKKSLFSKLRNIFKSKKSNNKKEKEINFDVIKFFSDVKALSKEEAEKYRDRIKDYVDCIAYTEASGQVALKEKLFEQLIINKYESILYGKGLYKAISEETLVKLAFNSPKALGLDYIKNYTRTIPLDIIKKKLEIDKLEVFDNYCILSYSPDGEVYRMTNKEKKIEAARRRDPILFGMICGSKKLYYIDSWVTPEDDLTLDKVIQILGKEIVEKDFLKEKIENL